MKRKKITEIKRFGSNLDAISWNSEKRARDYALVDHGTRYLSGRGKKSTDSKKSNRLFNKEEAYVSK